MAKFTQIEQGTRARLRGVACSTLTGVEFTLDLCVLRGEDEEQAIGAAQRRAKEIGIADSENDINFQFACGVELILRAAVDPESPIDRPEPFFDSAVQIRTSLDRERILYLSEMQREFQERISPRQKTLTQGEYYAHVATLAAKEEEGAGASDHPFWKWPRSTQETFLLTMAGQLANSLPLKSVFGSAEDTAHQKN